MSTEANTLQAICHYFDLCNSRLCFNTRAVGYSTRLLYDELSAHATSVFVTTDKSPSAQHT